MPLSSTRSDPLIKQRKCSWGLLTTHQFSAAPCNSICLLVERSFVAFRDKKAVLGCWLLLEVTTQDGQALPCRAAPHPISQDFASGLAGHFSFAALIIPRGYTASCPASHRALDVSPSSLPRAGAVPAGRGCQKPGGGWRALLPQGKG